VLRHPRPEVRVSVLESVAARGGALAERIGRLALNDKDQGVRIGGVRALGRSMRREAVADLARMLDQAEPGEQLAAAIALGTLGLPEVVTPLAKGTVIRGGCHAAPPPCADPFNATQLPVAALAASQVHPHMGTVLPSGRVAI